MNAEYILSGDPDEVRKIIQENRIRVARGSVTFTPRVSDTETDAKDSGIVDNKNFPGITDEKKPKCPKKKKAE